MTSRNRMYSKPFTIVLIALITITVPDKELVAGGVVWNGNVSSTWNDINNWSATPDGQDAVIDPANYTGVAASPDIDANSIYTPKKVTVENGAILTIQFNLTTSGDFEVDGDNSTIPTVNMSAGTLFIDGGKSLIIKKDGVFNLTGGTINIENDLEIEEGGIFNLDESDGASSITTDSDVDGRGKLKIKCKGGGNALFNMDAGTVNVGEFVEIDGDSELGAQNAILDISGGTFNNSGITRFKDAEGDDTRLNVSGGSVTLTGDIADDGAGTITMTVSGGTLVLQGNLTMEAGDLVTHSAGNIRFESVGKTWVNAGVLTSTGGTIEFRGSRTLSGAGTYTFYNVKVNDAAVATPLTISRNITIGNSLDMSAGSIDITGFELEIGTSVANPGTLTHTTGTVFGGTLKRWFAAASVSGDQGLFPIGISGEYRPVQLTSTSGITTGGSITASHSDASSGTDVSIDDGGTTIEKTHDMSSSLVLADGIAGGVFTVEVTMTAFDPTGNLSDIRLTKDGDVVGSHDDALGTVDNPTSKRTAVPTADVGGAWKAGTTDKAATPLPIVLIDFNAALIDKTQVQLSWATASEINNDFFTIERSTNGLTFETITEIPGAGTSSRQLDYNAIDDAPLDGVSYYRLKQTDYDGMFEYFNIVAVNLVTNPDGSCVLKVFPNPCVGQCTVNLSDCKHNENAEIKVEMIDAAGNLVYSNVPYRDFEGSFQFNIDTRNNLKPGVYVIRGTSSSESYHKKVLIK
ncbi:MAG: T9SS type A sorting domain-containing protein [Flavobacteriales bacterium]|nr:T9SS type A sorting domain-containing protein [Flavobacteriales bacterium]